MKQVSKREQPKKGEESSKKDYEWFIKEADVSKYAGQWIAIQNRKIVACSEHITKLLEEVRKKWQFASITKIPKSGQIMVL